MSSFGGDSDLHIHNDCNINDCSHSRLGHSYETPNGITPQSTEAYKYLAGSRNFTVAEIEIFKLI